MLTFGICCNWTHPTEKNFYGFDKTGIDMTFIKADSREHAEQIYGKYVELQGWDKERTSFNASPIIAYTEEELLSKVAG